MLYFLDGTFSFPIFGSCTPLTPATRHTRHAQVPPAFPVCFTHFRFYERPSLGPVFANQKKSEEDSHMKTKGKANIAFSVCLAGMHYRDSESITAKLLPRELHSAFQHRAALALHHLCEHLCFLP